MKLAKYLYCKNTTDTQTLPHLSQNTVIFTKFGPNIGIVGRIGGPKGPEILRSATDCMY